MKPHIPKHSLNDFRKKVFFLQNLVQLASDNIYLDSIFKGLLEQHLSYQCANPNTIGGCFCNFKSVYDSKKKKDSKIE